MQVQIDEILKEVRNAKCNDESKAVLWIVAILTGLDETVVDLDDVDVQRLSRSGLLTREKKGIVIDLNFTDDYEVTDDDVSEYREIWRGLFTGSMGSAQAIKDKATRWLKNNPGYTFDDIKLAAEYWIENKKREVSNPNLIGQADYFIYKKEGKDEISRLSSVVNEALEDSPGNDWTNTVI